MSPMEKLFTVGKYKVYFAGDRFKYKGIWLWNGVKNFRVIPFNNFKNWTGKEVQ